MHAIRHLIPLPVVLLFLGLLGCNLPAPSPTADLGGTAAASTLSALETAAAAELTAASSISETPDSTAAATTTAAPAFSPTPENPLVVVDTLCWEGPGNAYEVVSAIRSGTRVELLGQGTIPGWYVVRNPIYRDPCWIRASDMKVDIGINLAALRYFNPPPTPTETPKPEPSPTNTP